MDISSNPSNGTVTVSLNGTFTAAELLQHIHALCDARAQVVREVTRPAGVSARVSPGAPWYTEPVAEDPTQSLLVVLVKGLGWTGITLPATDRLKLASLLVNQQIHTMAKGAAPTPPAPPPMMQGGGGTLH